MESSITGLEGAGRFDVASFKAVRFEGAEGIDDKLSATLNDQNYQNLAYVIRVNNDLGRLGFYQSHRPI